MSPPAVPAGGETAAKYHTARFILVPSLRDELTVPVPTDRGPGKKWPRNSRSSLNDRSDGTGRGLGSAKLAGDDPQVAERVTDAARALAIGPVLDRHDHLGTVGDHAFADRVRVVDLDLEEDRGAAEITW